MSSELGQSETGLRHDMVPGDLKAVSNGRRLRQDGMAPLSPYLSSELAAMIYHFLTIFSSTGRSESGGARKEEEGLASHAASSAPVSWVSQPPVKPTLVVEGGAHKE